ncbi:MAG TPA: hypothetical protein VGE98_02385, partial [Thermoanaerobaculia bacterium]
MSSGPLRKCVLIVPDGAADLYRDAAGRSPMAAASTPNQDWLAAQGVSGRMQTLYPDLPPGSVVAQMGMLGWDPYLYGSQGRSAWELLARGDVDVRDGDLIFRANLVQLEGRRLISYNAGNIPSRQAAPLVERVNAALATEFPQLELYHSSDFRNILIIRQGWSDPLAFDCLEPHEREGDELDTAHLVAGRDGASAKVAEMLNRYLARVIELLAGEPANGLIPWSAASSIALPSFHSQTGFTGRAAIVGSMHFLHGIAKLGGIEFFPVGNGRPDTDYTAKGARVVELLHRGFGFVVCHINGPDEASHMRDVEAKIRSLEAIDHHIVGPVVEYFRERPEELGGVMVVPDHYTNVHPGSGAARTQAHSLHPVPFVLWNGRDRDATRRFDEDEAREGRYGAVPVSHLRLLDLLGVRGSSPAAAESQAEALV